MIPICFVSNPPLGCNRDFILFCGDPSSNSNFFANFVCWNSKCIHLPKSEIYTISAIDRRVSFSTEVQIPTVSRGARILQRKTWQGKTITIPKNSFALQKIPDALAITAKDVEVQLRQEYLVFRLWSGAMLTLNPCQLPGAMLLL